MTTVFYIVATIGAIPEAIRGWRWLREYLKGKFKK